MSEYEKGYMKTGGRANVFSFFLSLHLSMLPSLEIFKNIPCPDLPHCKRPQCIFAHGQQSTSSTSTTTSSVIPYKRSRPSSSQQRPKQQEQHQQCSSPSKALKVNKKPITSGPAARSISTPFGKDPSERVAHVATVSTPHTCSIFLSLFVLLTRWIVYRSTKD